MLGWLIAAAIAVSVLYGTYPSLHGGYNPSMAANIIYGTFSRFAWSIALAWVVFACNYGYGGKLNLSVYVGKEESTRSAHQYMEYDLDLIKSFGCSFIQINALSLSLD